VAARLTIHFSELPTREYVLENGGTYVLGRSPDCDLRLEDSRVSRRHARLADSVDGWKLTHLGSKNGLGVDGVPCEESVLADGAWIDFGGLPARFEHLSEAARQRLADRDLGRWRSSLRLQARLDPAEGLEVLLRRLLDSVLELSGAERGLVLLRRRDGELDLATAAGLEVEDLRGPAFSASVGAVERTLECARPVTLADTREDSRLGRRTSVLQGGIRALVCLPLTALGEVLGVVYADSREPGSGFTELDVEILSALAGHAALAIALVRVEEEVQALRNELPSGVWRRLSGPPEPPAEGRR